MAVKVIDTCAMIAFLEDEPGADIIEAILIDPANVCIAHAVNLSELYTHYCKYHTEADADEAVRLILEDACIVERQDADGDFWKGVGRILGTNHHDGQESPDRWLPFDFAGRLFRAPTGHQDYWCSGNLRPR